MGNRADGRLAIVGFHDGNAGQISCWVEETTGLSIHCYVDPDGESADVDIQRENGRRVTRLTEYPTRDSFRSKPLIRGHSWPDALRRLGITHVLPLTPNNRSRLAIIDICTRNHFGLVSAIHPSAIILPQAVLAAGVWVNAGAIVGYKAELESGVLVNTGAQIDHHAVLRSCSQVDPGVVLAGNVTLERCCHVHTGATIINRIRIGENAIIGAGAVVIADIPQDSTAAGVPARLIKTAGKTSS